MNTTLIAILVFVGFYSFVLFLHYQVHKNKFRDDKKEARQFDTKN